jgi:hypothetical protein
MSVREFAVSRLHCFGSDARARVRVAPLTLIFGQNNAGKSTLLRALAMFAASVGAPPGGALDLSSEAARGASFHDLRSRLDSVNDVAFTVSWAEDGAPLETAVFRFMEESDGSHVLRDISVRGEGIKPVDMRISVDVPGHYELVRDSSVAWSGPLMFSGVRPDPTRELPEEARTVLGRLAERLEKLRSSVIWLTAVRATVPRRRPVPHRESARGADGAWLQEHLAREASQSRRALIASVSSEFEAMFECALHVDLDERDVLLRGTPDKVQWRLPLADLGEGITQVLPVVTLCCMAERGDLGEGPILCLEQPEMHLHSDAERMLAAFLARVAVSSPAPQLVLETHSEILLGAVLLEVAEGRLRPDQLALHWVSRESAATESVVQQIPVDAKGNPEGWPPGAFGERSELARTLFLARRR